MTISGRRGGSRRRDSNAWNRNRVAGCGAAMKTEGKKKKEKEEEREKVVIEGRRERRGGVYRGAVG